MLKSNAIVEAPSILELRPIGVEHLPDALIDAGVLARLQTRHAGRVNAPIVMLVTDDPTGRDRGNHGHAKEEDDFE